MEEKNKINDNKILESSEINDINGSKEINKKENDNINENNKKKEIINDNKEDNKENDENIKDKEDNNKGKDIESLVKKMIDVFEEESLSNISKNNEKICSERTESISKELNLNKDIEKERSEDIIEVEVK